MKRNILKGAGVLLIVAAMLLSTIAVTADTKHTNLQTLSDPVIWDNGMVYDNLYWAMDSPPRDAYCADDFIFEDCPCEVTDVHWIGGYWNNSFQTAESVWCIAFYLDDGSGNKPDDLFAGPFCYEDPDKEELQLTELLIFYEFWVDLPHSIEFDLGTKYWILIWAKDINPSDVDAGWGFHATPIKLHMAVFKSQYWPYPSWSDFTTVLGYELDMCFQLTGNCPPAPVVFYDPPRVIPSKEPWEFDIASIDPEGNPLYYYIDWGDGKILESEYYESGEIKTFTHTWEVKGEYTIKAQAIDIHGAESEWAQIELEVPRSIITIPINFLRLFECFPNAFPIIRQILGL